MVNFYLTFKPESEDSRQTHRKAFGLEPNWNGSEYTGPMAVLLIIVGNIAELDCCLQWFVREQLELLDILCPLALCVSSSLFARLHNDNTATARVRAVRKERKINRTVL